MILYTPEEIKKIMEDNFEKSMDLVAFYHNLLVDFGFKKNEFDEAFDKDMEEFVKYRKDFNSIMYPERCLAPQPKPDSKKIGREFIEHNAATEPKKEWEILEGCSNGGGVHKWNDSSYRETCESQKCEIYSVKRLSDGEVFTVGNEIKHANSKIEEFKIGYSGAMYATNKEGVEININSLPPAGEKHKPKKVEVNVWGDFEGKSGYFYYQFNSKKEITKDKFPAIKQAIEYILNK